VDLDKIINTGMFDFDDVATSATWIQEIEKHHDEDDDEDDDDHDEHDHDEHEHHHEHGHEHHHHHHHHHDEGEAEEYGIGTFVYYARRPLNLGLFDEFVARKWPKSIIRAKGICYFKGEEDICYVFEQAGRQVSLRDAGQWYATMPKDELQNMMATNPQLQKDWDEQYGDRMQKLVFIGQHLDREQITADLDFCLA
jgi:G3E family GTPase